MKKSHFKIGTPERKILIALCFYALLMILGIPAFTVGARVGKLFGERLTNYFICEAQGVDPNNPGLCDELIDDFRTFTYPELFISALFLMGFFPVVFLIYTMNFEDLKAKWRSCQKRSESHEMRSTQITTTS